LERRGVVCSRIHHAKDVARNTDVSSFALSVAEVETMSGLDFFVELSAEDQLRLEADVDSSWFLK
jgi:hypothetical protein